MGKLLNLKQWLTLAEAAEHLSTVFDERVSESDLLRLALDGHLTLSCNLVNGARVRLGRIVPLQQADMAEIPPELGAALDKLPKGSKGKPVQCVVAIRVGDDRYLNLGSEVTTAWGVWDIPMLGGDRLDIEHMYQLRTDGPAITVQTLDGAFLVSPEDSDALAQLQESFEDNEYCAGSKASLASIKRRIDSEELSTSESETLLAQHEEARREFVEARRKRPSSDGYYPAPGLPDDAPIVIRTQEVLRFQQQVLQNSLQQAEKGSRDDGLGAKERTTLLAIIGLVAHAGDLDLDELPSLILRAAEEKGVAISRRTVEQKVRSVRIAMDDRST